MEEDKELKLLEEISRTEGDPVKLVESLSNSKYEAMSPKSKLLAFENIGRQLLKSSIGVIEKLEGERSSDSKIESSSFTHDDTKNVIKMSGAALKIQSFWRGQKTRFMAQSVISALQKTVSRKSEYNLLMQLNDLLKPKGLGLESLYKITATDYSDIPTIDFIKAIEKLNVPMGRKQLKKVCAEIDEDGSGAIKYTDYMQCLESFEIPTKLYANRKEGYGEECMEKLMGVLFRKKLSPGKAFEQAAESTTRQEVTLAELKKALEKLGGGFYRREIRAVALYLDPNKTGTVTKEEFLLTCKSAEARRKANRSAKPTRPAKTPEETLASIIDKMKAPGNISINDFVEMVGRDKLLSISALSEKLQLYYLVLSNEDVAALVRQMNFSSEAVAGKDVAKYFSSFCDKGSASSRAVPLSVYFKLMANYLKGSLEMSPEEYLSRHKVKETSSLTFDQFKTIVREIPETIEEKVIEEMWSSVDNGSAASLIDILESHETRSDPQLARYKEVFKKFSELLLEKGTSIRELFGPNYTLTFEVFNEKLKTIMKASDLDNLIEALKNINNEHVSKRQLIKIVKRVRELDDSGEAPMHESSKGTSIRKADASKDAGTTKITPESFIEVMFGIGWKADGQAPNREIHDAISGKYKGVLDKAEMDSLLNVLTDAQSPSTHLFRLLRFYDKRLYSPKWNSKVVQLDVLGIRAEYVRSRKASVAEYFRDLGIAAAQAVALKVFGRFLKHNYKASDQAVRRLCVHFAKPGEASLVLMQKVIEEVSNFTYTKTSAKLNCEGDAISALKAIEKSSGKAIQETFGNIDFNKDGSIDVQNVVLMLKNEGKVTNENLIEAAIRPLIDGGDTLSINQIQNYLARHSPSKEPSVSLELAHIHHNAQARGLDIQTYLKSLELDLAASVAKPEFVAAARKLRMNSLVAEMLAAKLQRNGAISMPEFVKLLCEYKYEPYGYGGKLTIDKIISGIETSAHPLFSILDHISFDEDMRTTLSSVGVGIVKVYPDVTAQYQTFITAHLDAERKESVKLHDVVAFIERNSKHSVYPNVRELAKKLVKNSSIIDADETLKLDTYISRFANILKLNRRDLYYLYDKLFAKISQMKTFKEFFAELERMVDRSQSRIAPKEIKSKSRISVEAEKLQSMLPVKNKVLSCICNYLYAQGKVMSEEILFRQMDTNRDGFIKKVEIKRWFQKAKIKDVTDQDVHEFFCLVDENSDGVLDFNEFLTAIKSVRGDAIISSVKVPITELVKQDAETILKQAIKKMTEYIAKEDIKTVEEKFMIHDKFKNGVLNLKQFKDALADLNIFLRPEEIE